MPTYAVTVAPPEGSPSTAPIVRHVTAESPAHASKRAASETGGKVISCGVINHSSTAAAGSESPATSVELPPDVVALLRRMNRSVMTIRTIMIAWFVLTLLAGGLVMFVIFRPR